jgi:two-component system sensor histidine kinase KdpD
MNLLLALTPVVPSVAYAPASDERLAATAHELRLPLSHIKGFVSTLLRADVEWDEATRRDFLGEIEVEADRLSMLIDHLLEVGEPQTAPTSAPDERRTVTPAVLVDGGLHRVRGFLRGRAVRVDLPPSLPQLRVDVEAIERVFANLVHNAAKYSYAFGSIRISARLESHGAIDIDVDDDGPGVPPGERAAIFDPYVRGGTAFATDVGHGLGLAISQSIVEAHGGSIRVDDAPGGGARFTVRLPVDLTR